MPVKSKPSNDCRSQPICSKCYGTNLDNIKIAIMKSFKVGLSPPKKLVLLVQ